LDWNKINTDCYKYLINRGLSKSVILEYSIKCEDGKPVFPVYYNGEVVAKSIRVGEPRLKYKTIRVKDIDPVPPFGLQLVDPTKPVILTEGQIDAMILYQLGYNSAASMGLNRIKSVIPFLGNDKIVIFPDYDGDITFTRMTAIMISVQPFIKNRNIYIVDMTTVAAVYNITEKMDINDIYLKMKNGADIIRGAIKYYTIKVKEIKKHRQKRRKSINISEQYIEEKISELWDTYTKFNRGYIVRCPYHDDTTPSLAIYVDTGTFYCFGCGKYGDVETLFKDKSSIMEDTNERNIK